MKNVIIVLIGISALSFILAVISSLFGDVIMPISPEAYSRTSNNLALIAIALALLFKGKNQ